MIARMAELPLVLITQRWIDLEVRGPRRSARSPNSTKTSIYRCSIRQRLKPGDAPGLADMTEDTHLFVFPDLPDA
jgi:hypothetical protein